VTSNFTIGVERRANDDGDRKVKDVAPHRKLFEIFCPLASPYSAMLLETQPEEVRSNPDLEPHLSSTVEIGLSEFACFCVASVLLGADKLRKKLPACGDLAA
jgi:hypothetical protein